MQDFHLADRLFNKDAAGNCALSVQVNQQGLIYCIFDEKAGQYVFFRKYSFHNVHLVEDLNTQIAEVLEKDDILSLRFQKVRFLGYTQQSTLVPVSYFSRSKMRDYLAFNHAGDIDRELFSSLITPPGIYNVFALQRNLVSLVSLHFKKVVFFNQTTPFLKHIALKQDAFLKPAVYVGLNSGFFDLAGTGDGKLRLYNTFQFVNESDLLYYVLYVYKQLNHDPQKVPLYVSGELISKISYFEILKQYIPETGYETVQGIPSLAPGLNQLQVVRFLNLLNLQTCALSVEHTGAEK
jgi:hypothetical protein